MATFTVNFTAATPDTYTIGWREQGSGDPFTIDTQVVALAGAASFTITIPTDDNIYCDGYVYEGYIIADCQDQTVDPVTGIPINAVQFTATFVQQTDPCPLYEITCDNAPIASVSVASGGTGYTTGDALVFTEANPGDELVPAVGTVVDNGAGGVSTVNITNFGSYKSAPTVTAPTAGTPATFNVNMEGCPNLITSAFACGSAPNQPADPNYNWTGGTLGDSFEICADVASLGSLPAQFTSADISSVDGTCNCISCNRVAITNNSGKGLRVQWQQCQSDPSNPLVLFSQTIASTGLPVDIGCVVLGTVHNLNEDVGTVTITDNGPC